jgi:uncharacterized membrane protein YfcA
MSAFIESPWQLLVPRILIGFGIGADIASGPALLSEVSPTTSRGLLMGLSLIMMPLGGLISAAVVPFPTNRWRGIYHDIAKRLMISYGWRVCAAPPGDLSTRLPEGYGVLGEVAVAFRFVELLLVSAAAGFIGALTGLGGGTVLVPIYTLFMGIPTIYAVGASLISTIATSSGAASAYVREGISNIRIGISLEIATTLGSIVGSLITTEIYRLGLAYILYIVFGAVLLFSLYPTYRRLSMRRWEPTRKPDWSTRLFSLHGEYYDEVRKETVKYYGVRWWLGFLVMFSAGMVSGLLGIGSGALKVLGMDDAMMLPMKVTTTTSNFMIGVTAATGSGIYWANGYIQPFLAAPTAIGVLAGAMLGTRALVKMRGRTLRLIFMAILAVLGVEMMLRGLGVM